MYYSQAIAKLKAGGWTPPKASTGTSYIRSYNTSEVAPSCHGNQFLRNLFVQHALGEQNLKQIFFNIFYRLHIFILTTCKAVDWKFESGLHPFFKSC